MKQQPSAIAMTSLSGHSGGTTATITGIVRRKSNPRQPRTPAQQSARETLAYLSRLWGGLNEAEQNAWIAAAPNKIKVKNGVAVFLKGNTYFNQVNGPIVNSGQDPILLPPAPGEIPSQPIIKIFQSLFGTVGDDLQYYYILGTPYNDSPTGDWVISPLWTGWINSGKFSFPKANKIIVPGAVSAYYGGTSINFWAGIPGSKPPLYEGQKAKIILRYVNKVTGQIAVIDTREITAEAVAPPTNSYQPDSINGTSTLTGTEPNQTLTQQIIGDSDPYDFDTWEPYIFMTVWGTEEEVTTAPITTRIPNSAVSFISSTEFNITFGPGEGNAAGPTAEGQFAVILIAWINTSTGEYSRDNTLEIQAVNS